MDGTRLGTICITIWKFNFTVNVKETGYNWIFDLVRGERRFFWFATMGMACGDMRLRISYKKYESKE